MGYIKGVFNLNGMHGLTGNGCQKLGDSINYDAIHAALHGSKEMMVKTFQTIASNIVKLFF